MKSNKTYHKNSLPGAGHEPAGRQSSGRRQKRINTIPVVVLTIMAVAVVLLAASPSLRWSIMLTVNGVYENFSFDDTSPADRLKKAEERLSENPDDAEAWYEKGLALHGMNTRDGAMEAAERAIEIDPMQNKFHWLKCYIIERLYEPEEALALLKEHAGEYPDSVSPWQSMEYVYHRIGEYENARNCTLRIAELEPEKPSHYGFLASTMLYGGEIEESLPYFDKAFELMGDVPFYNLSDRALCAMFTSQKAHALSLLGRYEEALRLVDKARKLHPNDSFYITPFVYSSVALGNVGNAVEEASRSRFQSPDDNRLLAYALLNRNAAGDRTIAVELLLKALNYAADKDKVLIYALIDDPDKAFETMERVYAANPHLKEFYTLSPELLKLRDDPRFALLTGA